jgi:hypothetical protein
MEINIFELFNSIDENVWFIPVLLIMIYFFWLRTINYQEPINRKANVVDRLFSGLNHLLMSNLRRLVFLDLAIIIISFSIMLILDSAIQQEFDNLPYFIFPLFFVIGLIGAGLLLMAKLSNR